MEERFTVATPGVTTRSGQVLAVEDVLVDRPVDVNATRAGRPAFLTRSAGERLLSVAGACVATAMIHAFLLRRALGPDEAGFSVVARFWHESEPHLYGPLWVDRPPGLVAVFDVANRLGPYGAHAVATAFALVIVLAISSAARTVGGDVAARWSAWTAAAFTSTMLLQAGQLNGELIGAALLSLACAAGVKATRVRAMPAAVWGAAAGVASVGAVFVKQNLLDGVVFVVVLLAATAWARRWSPAATAAGIGVLVGWLACVAVALRWAVDHGGPAALGFAMYGFRSRAAAVMGQWSLAAPERRLGILLLLAIGSLMLPMAVAALAHHRESRRRLSPEGWAIFGTASFECVSMLGGMNFWPHYLLSFVPMLALGVGLAARDRSVGARRTRRLAVAAVAVSAVVALAAGVFQGPGRAWVTGRWIAAASRPGDTIVVAYTHANVVQASGLRPGYPYLWSLPTRTLDPHLAQMTEALQGPHRATWFVHWDDLHSWGLDGHGQIGRALHAGYRRAGQVCGHPVWLRGDAARPIPPTPTLTHCGGGAV